MDMVLSQQTPSYSPVVEDLATEHMSAHPKNINVPLVAQVVVPDYLAVDVVDFKAGMVCLDSLLDFG